MAKSVSAILKLKDQFSSPMQRCAKQCEAFNSKAKLTNRDIQNMQRNLKNAATKSIKQFGVAIAAVGTATAAVSAKLVKDTVSQADTIDKMSQKIGISRQAYQELDFVTSQCGASIGNMKAGVKTLTKQMSAAANGTQASVQAFDELGVSIYDSNGNLKSQEDMMWESMKALQGMTNQTEKAALANQLFGRAGTELMPMLNGEKGSIDELREKARELGLIMGDDTVDAGVKLNDTLDQMKRSVSAAAMSIGGELLPYVQSACDYVMRHMPQIREGVKAVASRIASIGTTAKKTYAALQPFIPLLAGIVSALAAFKIIKTITTMVATAKAVMTAVNVVLGVTNATMLACPLTWIVIAIAAVVAAGVALYKNWGKVCEWAENLKEKFEKLLQPIKSVVEWLGKVFGFDGKGVSVSVNKGGADTTVPMTAPSNNYSHATGTSYFRGGYTGFSEGGRAESAIFPSGTKIVPASKSGAESKSVNVYVTVQGNMIGNRSAMEEFAEFTGNKILTAMGNV